MNVYYVRMDSAITGDTLAASHFLGADGVAAKEAARESFSRRLTEADVADLSPDMAERILDLDRRSGENMAAGVTFHVRRSATSPRNASNFKRER